MRLAKWFMVAVLTAGTLAAVSSAQRFTQTIFSTYEPLVLRVEGPLDDLIAHAQQDNYSVRGALTYRDGGQDVQVPGVKISVRGHTSRNESECTFPKLKLEWASGSLKIGTRCRESTDSSVTPRFGRLPNERSPLREAFVYQLLDTLEVPSLKARPARITYVSGPKEPLVRNGLVLEEESDALHRVGAHKEIPPEQFTSAREAFSSADSAALAFAEAMIGNFDWCLRFFPGDTYRCDARRPLWNVLAFAWSDGTVRPLMYDFDVSGTVAGQHRWFNDVFNEAFLPSASHAQIEVISQLQRTRTLFARADLDRTRQRFMEKKADAYRALDRSDVDADGRRTIKEYLDAFFDGIGSDEAFYRPVVTARDTAAYADANRSTSVCSARGAIPVGTPVSDPLQTSGDMIQVRVLDALWHWAPPVTCPEMHKTAVWIDKAAVGRDYP
jgi:hypothetical protein